MVDNVDNVDVLDNADSQNSLELDKKLGSKELEKTFCAYGFTDKGRVRESNQDAFICGRFSEHAIYAIVCDGMGGGKDGNIASATAVKTVSNYMVSNFHNDIKESSLKNLMISAIDAANIEIFDYSTQQEYRNNMGTTIVLVVIIGNKAYIAHVGDSRAYLLNDRNISQITKDHSLVQSMVEEGKITPEQARNHPRKNLITRAVGIDDIALSDFNIVTLEENSRLLICSDGLTNMVEDEDIHKIILGEKEPSNIPMRLVHEANMAGGSDNITVVYI